MKIKAIIIIFIVFATQGCISNGLVETPKSLLDPESFFNTENDFESALVGVFRPLFSDWASYDYCYPLILTSGAEDVSATAEIYKRFDNLTPNDGEQVIRQFWAKIYLSITNANIIIGNEKNAKGVAQARLGELLGQAKFARAFNFFTLVRLFGEVQLTTFENQNDIETLKQSSVSEIYASIINDLEYAESSLPDSFPERGRPNKWAAKALLAKVYLTMAGWPLKDNSAYIKSRDKAKEVIDSGLYELMPNYADLWKNENRLTNKEFIFAFYGSIASEGVSGSHMFRASRPSTEGGWGDFHSEPSFYNSFPEGPRKDASFSSVVEGIPYIAKYREDENKLVGNNGEGAFVVLRYSDVLLMYAEAANKSEGTPSDEAIQAVNKVIRRAQGKPINTADSSVDLNTGITQTMFDSRVIQERNWELAFEMNRWFDLVRREKMVDVLKQKYPHVSNNNRLLPKPASQLIPRMLNQNLGY